jgi:DNA-binding response OmpR family regulator
MVPQNPNADITILFADDDGQLQKFVSELLIKCGYNLIAANDGRVALQKAREFDGVIHLLLSDVDMPGMTGVELATQLGRERPATKVLLISGVNSGLLVLNNGWQFLPKPFMADMLRDKVRDFLSEQPPTPPLPQVEEQLSVRRPPAEVPPLATGLTEIVPAATTHSAPPIKHI